ncbi:hypothetical protein BGX26_012281 [Mortierella sp. AD094]|nr:hypothetical protein BGX26_012281 [Mortierella sp. AD094]
MTTVETFHARMIMSTTTDQTSNAGQDSQSYLRPTQDDLIPTTMDKPEASRQSEGNHTQTRDPVGPNMDEFNEQGTVSAYLAEPRPGEAISAISMMSKSHANEPADGIYNRKRVRLSGKAMRGLIHKPFRSPVRTVEASSSNASKAAVSTKQVDSSPSSDAGSSHQIQLAHSKKALLPETQNAPSRPIISSSALTAPQKSKISGTRKPFRSPIVHSGKNSRHSGDGAYSRRIQIQALQSKITELQSSIRKARQIVQQQEKNDTPLQELIDKWKKACQEGAQVLLEKYIAQEQFFGGNEDTSFSTDGSKLGSYSEFNDWGYASKIPAQDYGHLQGLRGLSARQIEAMEDSMETQDLQYDLPTVEEAIHTRIMPEPSGETPRAMTKMKKLLMGLGIDPTIIGYNAEQDTFTSEELPYESP